MRSLEHGLTAHMQLRCRAIQFKHALEIPHESRLSSTSPLALHSVDRLWILISDRGRLELPVGSSIHSCKCLPAQASPFLRIFDRTIEFCTAENLSDWRNDAVMEYQAEFRLKSAINSESPRLGRAISLVEHQTFGEQRQQIRRQLPI